MTPKDFIDSTDEIICLSTFTEKFFKELELHFGAQTERVVLV